ncbi:hypothetical protein LXL04_030658 [Taraxacum kok-saghyz]
MEEDSCWKRETGEEGADGSLERWNDGRDNRPLSRVVLLTPSQRGVVGGGVRCRRRRRRCGYVVTAYKATKPDTTKATKLQNVERVTTPNISLTVYIITPTVQPSKSQGGAGIRQFRRNKKGKCKQQIFNHRSIDKHKAPLVFSRVHCSLVQAKSRIREDEMHLRPSNRGTSSVKEAAATARCCLLLCRVPEAAATTHAPSIETGENRWLS